MNALDDLVGLVLVCLNVQGFCASRKSKEFDLQITSLNSIKTWMIRFIHSHDNMGWSDISRETLKPNQSICKVKPTLSEKESRFTLPTAKNPSHTSQDCPWLVGKGNLASSGRPSLILSRSGLNGK